MKLLKFKITSIVILLFLTGCGNDASQFPNGELVLYSGRSESLIAPLVAQFSKETGINLKVRYGTTAELAATIIEEGQNSPADLFFAQDPGGLGALAVLGILAQLPQEILDLVEPGFRSANGLWVGVSGRARVVAFNTDNLDIDDLPSDLQGFTDPKWKGRIGLPPTNSSFQTMVTAMRMIWGEDETRQWLQGIMANEPQFYEKNTPTVAAVGSGEVDIGFVNHYYLFRFLQEEGDSFPARNYFLPSGGPGSLVMVAGIGRLVTGPNQENALKFIQFLLSIEAQQYFANETFEYPMLTGVEIQAGLIPLSELNAINIDLSNLADLQGTVKLLQEVGMLP